MMSLVMPFIFVSTSYFAVLKKKKKWASETVGNSSVTRSCDMNERMAHKRLFLDVGNYWIPDEDPPWALKFSSDVHVMDRNTRTSE